MNPVKLVIADDDPIVCNMIQEYFANRNQVSIVGIAHDGQEVTPLLWETSPEVLLLDLVMPNKDGFQVLEMIQEMPDEKRPSVITLTALSQETILLRTRPYSIYYYMLKPFDLSLLYQLILEAAGRAHVELPEGSKRNIDTWITNTLCTLGIPPNFIGFSLLRQGVKLAEKEPVLRYNMTKSLYPRLASQFGSTPDNVERNMRHALQTAWMRGGARVFQEILRYSVLPRQPSISEFISLMIERMHMAVQ